MGWGLGIALLVAVLVVALVALRMPRGSGGAPGEVTSDAPLSEPTGASMDGHAEAGGAEDRPGGPGQETMDPDDTAAADTEHGSGGGRCPASG